ncbi:hypothetical protein OTU49_008921, partial [Cherax quadricarinatus]
RLRDLPWECFHDAKLDFFKVVGVSSVFTRQYKLFTLSTTTSTSSSSSPPFHLSSSSTSCPSYYFPNVIRSSPLFSLILFYLQLFYCFSFPLIFFLSIPHHFPLFLLSFFTFSLPFLASFLLFSFFFSFSFLLF